MMPSTSRVAEDRRITNRLFGRILRRARSEQGGSLVEMALVCAFVYLPMLFGIFQVSYGIYTYNVVCSTAHQLTRYAAVRGFYSCTIAGSFVNCNMNPTGSSNPAQSDPNQALLSYVPKYLLNSNNLTVNATWYSVTYDNSSGFSKAQWTQCTTSDNTATPCNLPGYQVQVQVTYNFPLNIPFWGRKTIPITSVSRMMINE